MIYDAISTFRGEVVDHPYEAGLAYNIADRGRRRRRASAIGRSTSRWPAAACARSSATREGRPIEGLAVTGVFAAPADMKRDRRFAMQRGEPRGLCRRPAPPPAGVWDLKLKATRGGETLFQSKNRVALR